MLQLTEDTVAIITRWAKKHPTVEVTGLIASGPDGQRVQPMRNIARQPDRFYEWSPSEMGEAWDRMEERKETPLAFYHSHPSGKPDPSERDMEGALHDGVYYVIVYPDSTMTHPEVHWHLSVWECLEPGILIEGTYEVIQ